MATTKPIKKNYVENVIKELEDYRHVLSNEGADKTGNILLDDIQDTFIKCFNIAVKKNNDYAGENANQTGGDPFKNFRASTIVGVPVQKAILVRLMDKMARIGNLLDQKAAVKDESISDTILDAINYLAILQSTIKNKIS